MSEPSGLRKKQPKNQLQRNERHTADPGVCSWSIQGEMTENPPPAADQTPHCRSPFLKSGVVFPAQHQWLVLPRVKSGLETAMEFWVTALTLCRVSLETLSHMGVARAGLGFDQVVKGLK